MELLAADRTPTTCCHAFLDKPMDAVMDTQLIFTLIFATRNNPAPTDPTHLVPPPTHAYGQLSPNMRV